MRVFWFLLLAMVVVVAAVTLAVVGGGKSAVLQDVAPEQLTDPLPVNRPVGRADIEAMRLPVVARGYRMTDVDDALGRLGAELAERDARIAELESALMRRAGDRSGRQGALQGAAELGRASSGPRGNRRTRRAPSDPRGNRRTHAAPSGPPPGPSGPQSGSRPGEEPRR